MKNLNSPDVQKSADKLKEAVVSGMKKSNEAFTELLQKFGLAPPASIQKTINEAMDEMLKSFKVLQVRISKL